MFCLKLHGELQILQSASPELQLKVNAIHVNHVYQIIMILKVYLLLQVRKLGVLH